MAETASAPISGLQYWERRTSAGHLVTGWHSQPSNRPVVHFIHGNGYNGLVYLPLLERLARDYDLFLSDIQGHGASEANGDFLGWNRTSELCEETWRAFAHLWSGQRHYAMGHSFGGIMSLLMMDRDPALFDQAVLLDPIIFTRRMLWVMRIGTWLGLWQNNGFSRQTRQRRRVWPNRAAALESLEGRGMFKGWTPEALRAYVDHALEERSGEVALRCPPELEAAIFAGYPAGLWRAMKKLRTPTHVIHGDSTYDFVRESVARWVSFNPHVSAESLPGGHCFMQQTPETAVERVRAALAPVQ
ncbi:alpha/beta fold hydrolase [Halomonadaceae bacterium KBTZ08]